MGFYQVLLLLLHLVVIGVIALMAVRPTVRQRGAVFLALVAGAALIQALGAWGGTSRSLKISHSYPAYEGFDVVSKAFPIESVEAAAQWWGLLVALFCLCWATWGFMARGGQSSRSFGVPVLLAWSGCALQLLLEKVAAPVGLVIPFDQGPDRALFPATIVGAFLLAQPGRKILHLVAYLSLLVAVTRLPLAVFGTLATQNHWGTHLDVHAIDFFKPTISPVAVPIGPDDGTTQLLWLIWLPQLIIYPAIYMMSTGSVAFMRLMLERHREQERLHAEG